MEKASPPSRDTDRLERFLQHPRRAVWIMALPMMAGMMVHTLYIIVDTAFIGSLGTDALAAVTFVGPLFFLMLALTMGLGTAVTALVAQAVGRRDPEGADLVGGTAMGTALVLGLALAASGLLSGRSLLSLLGAEGATVELAWQYFSIIALVAPLFFVGAIFRAVLTGEGDARTPMAVMAAATLSNIGLDALFIFGLGMGIRGAAVATALAQIGSLAALAFLVLRRQKTFVRFRVSTLLPTIPILRRIGSLGVPTAAGMLVMSFGAILYNRLLAGFGEITVAAFGAGNKVDMIVAMPILGLAAATVSVIGMFAGAGRSDLVRSTAWYAYRWALLLAVLIGATAYLESESILRIFTEDPTAIAIGTTYLGYMIFAYPMMAFGMTTGRILQGLGHGLPSLVITTVRVLGVGVPVAYAAVYIFGAPVEAVWSGVLAGGFCATLLSLYWVRRLIWLADPTAKATAIQPALAE